MTNKKNDTAIEPTPEATQAPETVTMVNESGTETNVKPMHVPAWEQMGYKVKENDNG
jgi:hypothetical protein